MIIKRATKLRIRRVVRRKRRQAEDMGFQAGEQFDKLVVRRWDHLRAVLRFVFGWVGLLILLGGILVFQVQRLGDYYLVARPVSGGTYTEGILGSFTNANPIYATSLADATVSRLVFSGLMRSTGSGLKGDLAETLEQDAAGKVYTARLRPDLQWQDGTVLTAADVVYTFTTIQNPDAQSPLQTSWQGVKIEAKDNRTVVFTLPNALSSFPYSLTTGIIPQHLLGKLSPSALRSASFNTVSPVGSGPFGWSNISVVGSDVDTREERVTLLPFERHQGGKPQLDAFVVRTFRSTKALTEAYANQELTGMVGVDRLPDAAESDANVHEYTFPLSSGIYVFLRVGNETLSDVKVRRALQLATDPVQVQAVLGYPTIPVRQPFLLSHKGLFNPALQQTLPNIVDANRILDEAGWPRGADGIREKAGKKLELVISSQQDADYERVVDELARQWKEAGVKVTSNLVDGADVDSSYIVTHNYDILVYGIAIGPDPDVFAYWHSSQADISNQTHLNLSEYRSATADAALEAGRTRSDVALRAAKYRPFLEAWKNDVPAIGLYQPRFAYFTSTVVDGLEEQQISDPADRFIHIEDWKINTVRTSE